MYGYYSRIRFVSLKAPHDGLSDVSAAPGAGCELSACLLHTLTGSPVGLVDLKWYGCWRDLRFVGPISATLRAAQ